METATQSERPFKTAVLKVINDILDISIKHNKRTSM